MNKFLSIIIVGLFLSAQGCDFIYSLLDKKGAEEKEIVGEISPFIENPEVEEVQVLLRIYGYNPGKADGKLGVKTREALGKFQKDMGLEESKFVDQETWAKLKIFKDAGFINEESLNVEKIQETLSAAGFKVGAIDGNFGPKTKEAIMSFQKAHDLKIDGKVGYQTLMQLLNSVAEQ